MRMTKEDRVDELIAKRYSCSQVTLGAVCEDLGLPLEEALKISACFGGGMGMGSVCGALTGGLMALGLLTSGTPEAKEENHKLTGLFIEAFREKNGGLYCKDLLGFDPTTPEGKERMHSYDGPVPVCRALMQTSVEMIVERIGSK